MNQDIKKYDDYYESLVSSLRLNEPVTQANSDRAHNCVVMRFIFNNAKGEIVMLCGEMSILRPKFYKYISENISHNVSSYLKEKLCESLSRYFDNKTINNRLRIVTESSEDLKDIDFVHEDFKQWISEGKVEIRTLGEDYPFSSQLMHFTFASQPSIYRFEYDCDSHGAVCVINAQDYSVKVKNLFDSFWNISTPLTKCS